MESLRDFYRVTGDPYGYARELKATGKHLIGYFCSYTPEEIIHAAGAHPLRLFGTTEEISRADAHLQSYSCSLVRSALEDALSGNLDFLDGTVFPHTCDSIQRLSDIWRLNTGFSFFADVVFPVKLKGEGSRRYMVAVLERFRTDLGRGLGKDISDSALRASCKLFNDIRHALKTLYELRSENPAVISGRDMDTVVRASMIMERQEFLERITALLEELKMAGEPVSPDGRKRLILAGSICNHPDIFKVIEESGGVVVWDDLCTGSRSFEGIIEDGPDPVVSLADRYATRLVCPAKHISNTARGDALVKMVREHQAGGVVFLLIKFCDPHAFDYPYLKEFLERERVPSMLLEIEDRLPSEGQLRTRFETFVETI